jgi:chemotaxis family two-component system response regulator Rcp1
LQKPNQILIVEDSKADALLIRRSLQAVGIDAELHFVHDGQQATQFFDRADTDDNAPCPDVVLLDLNLPKKNGDEVLAHMRRSRTCKDAAALVVTSSDCPRDRANIDVLVANGYFRKPSNYAEFLKLGPIVKRLLKQSIPEDGA